MVWSGESSLWRVMTILTRLWDYGTDLHRMSSRWWGSCDTVRSFTCRQRKGTKDVTTKNIVSGKSRHTPVLEHVHSSHSSTTVTCHPSQDLFSERRSSRPPAKQKKTTNYIATSESRTGPHVTPSTSVPVPWGNRNHGVLPHHSSSPS